jgi:dihydrofolate synthase/folylpolyglutamate synthase
MSYSETIQYLYSLQKQGIKFGLSNITKLMSSLGDPQKSFPSIHIAGTNGKGSTSAIIASILNASGLKVGLFTSPHLVSFTERIRVNGEEIAEFEVIRLAEEARAEIVSLQSSDPDFLPTFFEVVTAIALLYFKKEKIDIAVVEVGMGGRLDATNIVIPEVSVITNISYDHSEFLGDTLEQIAREKAGIIKKGVPVVVSSQVPDVVGVIEERAEEIGTVTYFYGREFSSMLREEDISGIYFDYQSSDSFMLHELYLPLTGEHQMENASVAIKAVELFNERRLIPNAFGTAATHHSSLITHHSIKDGLATVRWPGRLEMIKHEPPILIDGAHNPAAAVALSHALANTFLKRYRRIILVLGIMGDKDIEGIMRPLLHLASEIILCSPNYERAASPERLANVAVSLGFSDVHIVPTVKDALESAINICEHSNSSLTSNDPSSPPFRKGGLGEFEKGEQGKNGNSSLQTYQSSLIVVTGSFYTIGEAKESIGYSGVLMRLRE